MTQEKNIDLSVIAPVFEGWDIIWRLFQALEAQTFAKDRYEVIMVDNGSTFIPEAIPSFVKLLKCEKPGSYAARNIGIDSARGELLVFTDADCVPINTWLEDIWNAYTETKGKALLAGSVEVKSFEREKDANIWELYDSYLGLPQERFVKKRGYAVTANVAVPRSAFDDVGMFDSARFSGGDAEFCQRAVAGGYELQYLESARVFHPARSTWEELARKSRRLKGGQFRNGPLKRRVWFFFRHVCEPPIGALKVFARRSKYTLIERLRIYTVLMSLWCYESLEIVLLLLGKTPERR